MGDIGQERSGRAGGPLAHIRHRGHTLGDHDTDHDEGDDDADNDGDGAEDCCPLPVLAGDPPGEDDGDQTVGADDVTGEDQGVNSAEENHPQTPTPHEAARVHGGLLTRPGLLLRRRLTARLHTGQGLEVGPGAGGDAPVDHSGQPEPEQHREQRVGPPVDEQRAHPQPDRVDGIAGSGGPCHAGPEGDIGQRDEQEHEATGHIRGGIAHPSGTGERCREFHTHHARKPL